MLNLPFIRALSSLLDNATLLTEMHDLTYGNNEIGQELATIGYEF
jgi:hypothetical protein